MEIQEENAFFWKMIEQSNKKINAPCEEYNIDEHIDYLTELLSKVGKEKLIAFEKVFQKTMDKLYTAEIAELSIIIENEYKNEEGKIVFKDYISTDGFIYFRCWLILKGKTFFDDITKDINAFVNGKYSFNIGDTWAEGLIYVTNEANMKANESVEEYEITDFVREHFPEIMHYDLRTQDMNRAVKRGDELQKMYPILVNEIIKIK